MTKPSKISFKLYQNERIHSVSFHGQEVHPLYVQLIHDRKPVYFKSYFFDLLSNEKYIISGGAEDQHPNIDDVISKEERLLNYLTQPGLFSFDTLKEDYVRGSFDLLYCMDADFKEYMMVFFCDEGKPEFARIVLGARSMITSNGILEAFKGSLKPALYSKLIEHAAYYAPPYLPLEAFSKTLSKDAFSTFSLYEWNDPAIQVSFKEFLQGKYPNYNLKDVQQAARKVVRAANL
jgi:hypothetical protein